MNGNIEIMTNQIDRTKFNVIGPDMVAELTPYHKRIATQIVLSPHEADGDVYAQNKDPNRLAPTKHALLKLADAAGVRWNYRECKNVSPSVCEFCRAAGDNCLKCKHHGAIAYQAVGAYQDAAGQWRPLTGSAEVDLSERSDGEARRMGVHLRRHVESRAFNAAIRTLGIKQAYTPAELKKPFVVIRTYFDGYSDPDFKRLLLARAASDAAELYGEQEPHPQLSMQARQVLQLAEGDPAAALEGVDMQTGEIIEGQAEESPQEALPPGGDAPAQTADSGQEQLPWNDAEVPQPTEQRPRTITPANGEEFCAAVYKYLPRYRDASHPGKVNTFSMMASLKRAGITTVSDARAWPHLCMRNDAEAGRAS